MFIQSDHFVHQSQIAGHISGRDVPKRVSTAGLLASICHMAGYAWPGLIAFGCIVFLEVVVYPLNRRASQFDRPLSFAAAIAVFCLNWLAMLPSLSFSIILSQSDTLPFVLIAYIWAFGIYVHVSNTFGLLPIYNWSQMSLAFSTIFLMLWNVASNPAFQTEALFWISAMIVTVVYIVNTFDTMRLQRNTHDALEAARREAGARLLELERLSRIDSLTGLMNRRAFDEIVQSMMNQHANKQGVTVFTIDLDGFKPINDSYGHEAGDAVLCAIAERLTDMAENGDQVARVGGDEFAILTGRIMSMEAAEAFAKQTIQFVTATIPFQQKQLAVGVSIGIARQGPDATTPTELLSGADQAMYSAKQDPDEKVKIYDKAAFPIRPTLEDRKTLIAAMENGLIRPHYQPKVNIKTGEIIGFEALSRWHHPSRGILPPSQFIPMINELALQGAFMINTAEFVMRDLAQMVENGLDPGQMSINVSEVTLATLLGRNDLFEILDRYPALRHYLTFEITEDIFIARSSEIIRRSINLFRQAGVRISLDDFGTGYASLQHLKELDFDELKLDTQFVRDLGIDPAAEVLIEGLVTISKGLEVDLIAEGVETQSQREMLMQMGCHYVQGYYFGAAIPFEQALERLSQQKSAGMFSQPRVPRVAV